MFFEIYDTVSPAGEVWLLNIYFARVTVRYMIAASSKPNKLHMYTPYKARRGTPSSKNDVSNGVNSKRGLQYLWCWFYLIVGHNCRSGGYI